MLQLKLENDKNKLVPFRTNLCGVNLMIKYINAYYDYWFAVNEIYEKWAKSRGLTSTAIFILYVINETGCCDQSFICRRLFLAKQTVSGVLSVLEKQGYVKKSQGNIDKRNKIVAFTDVGKEYATKILSDLYDFEEKAFASMSGEERSALIKYNRIFLERLQKSFNIEGELS